MKIAESLSVPDEAVGRVRLGKWVTTRDEDNLGTKHLIAHPIAVDALKNALERRRVPGNVLSIRSDLGRAIYNARVGEERSYRRDAREVSVWIVLIEDAQTTLLDPAPTVAVPLAVAA